MMSSEESYNANLKKIRGISDNDIVMPKMRREDIIGESEELKVAALADREGLIGVGLNPEFIDSLDERIGAYSFASSLHETSVFKKSDSMEEWKSQEKDAYSFKSDMIQVLRFALRKDPEQLNLVKKISQGYGRRDLVNDFIDIYTLGKKNEEALKAINFDFPLLDRAKELHDQLSNLLADANMSPDEIDQTKKTAYQAYTWLYEALNEIREYGQFCFRNDAEKQEKYKSDFHQQIGSMSNKNSNESEELAENI